MDAKPKNNIEDIVDQDNRSKFEFKDKDVSILKTPKGLT